jgi:acetolactate synthase-1/2/3 large subunit
MNMNRREALGVLGSLGATAALPSTAAAGSCVLGGLPGCGVKGNMTGAKAAVEALCLEGTRCVFGIPGAQNNEFWDAMKSKGLPYLLVANEFSASIMADGAARATGAVGVFSVVPGPGVTNALTGIGEALLDSAPIVGVITDVSRGQCDPAFQVHSLPVADLLRPATKEVIEVRHPCEIPDAVHRAFRVAKAGEPGPAAVVIPFDLYNKTWDYDCTMPAELPAPFDEQAYQQALHILSNRNCRVGIYAGMGCLDAGPSLMAVADMLQAPVATSVSGKGCIPDSHPLAVGWGYGPQGTRAAEAVFKEVDVLLAVGVRYSEVSTANYSIPCHERLIHVDANPNNLGRNVHACVKACADARLFLNRLLADAAMVQRTPCPALWQRIANCRQVDRCENTTVQIPCGVDPMIFITKLREAMAADDLLFVDVTASVHWASEAFDVPGPRRYFTPANNQSMGWAVAAAIGAQQVRPERQVVSVTGDGCFLMSGLEISTAARAGIPVKFFVLADGAYHYMQMLQQPLYRRTTATEIAAVDYAALAKGLGVGYNEIGSNSDLAAGIAGSLALPGAVLTRVCVNYEGREKRWLGAVRESYINHLSTGQKVRAMTRIGVRSLNRHPHND